LEILTKPIAVQKIIHSNKEVVTVRRKAAVDKSAIQIVTGSPAPMPE
jgi:hypothetical protein